MKKGVLLVNLGSPDSPAAGDVRKYLREFLLDPRVIDIHPVSRWFLINFIIAPFRAPKSAALYQKIWTPEGSPLIVHGKRLKAALQDELGQEYAVTLGMRYQKPSIEDALDELREKKVSHITVVPLYPQYASSSTGTVIGKVQKTLGAWQVIPHVKIISSFYDHPGFIDAFADIALRYNPGNYDHILFSYHGLPERQIHKASAMYGDNSCRINAGCCSRITEKNRFCYRANCFETTRLLAAKLGIPEGKYTVCFQSRLGRTPWIKPYSDEVIKEKAGAGIKKLLVFSPAFVADCLETLYEIGVEYDHLFREHGGEKVQLVESLNEHPLWIKCLQELVTSS